MRRILALSLFAALSCTGYRPTRFAERPPVVEARDDQPIASPHWHWVPEPVYISEVYLHRPLREALDLSPYPDAGDVNSFDDVVRSTWFAPKRLDLGAMARGPDTSGPPRPPFTVLSDSPMTFSSTGFCITDARGQNTRSWSIPRIGPKCAPGRFQWPRVSVGARVQHAAGLHHESIGRRFLAIGRVGDRCPGDSEVRSSTGATGATVSQRCRGLRGSSWDAPRSRACEGTIPTI